MRRKRRLHKPEFKAKVALAAVKDEMTLADMVKKFDVRPAQITQWKNNYSSQFPQPSIRTKRLLLTIIIRKYLNCLLRSVN